MEHATTLFKVPFTVMFIMIVFMGLSTIIVGLIVLLILVGTAPGSQNSLFPT